MRGIIYFLVLIFTLSITGLQVYSSGWEWQSPLPQGLFLSAVCFTDANTGYIADIRKGIVYKTTDGGENWTKNYDARAVRKILFLNSDVGFILGAMGRILKTTDAGETWDVITIDIYLPLYDLFFIDNYTGFIIAGSSILKTTDAGETWTEIYFFGTYSNFRTLFFVDENTGYVAGTGIQKTTDGGVTWDTVNLQGNMGTYSMYFLNAETGFVTGPMADTFKTTDGGESWTVITELSSGNFYSIQFFDENTGYIVGEKRNIFKTEDAGETWTELLYNHKGGELRSLSIVDNNIAFTVGDNGVILKTSDGGENWVDMRKGIFRDLYSVSFIDTNTGFVAGYEAVFKTNDAGKNWIELNNENNYTFINLFFFDENTGYGVADGNLLHKTTDGGETWTEITIETKDGIKYESYSDNFFADNYRSMEYGDDVLQKLKESKFWVKNIFFYDVNTGYAAGSNNMILKTTDGGETWTAYHSGVNSGISTIYFPTADTGYVAGYFDIITKTTDGGETWTEVGTCYCFLVGAHFTDGNSGGFIGDKTFITTDGGQNWVLKEISGNDIFFVDKDISYVAANDGRIFITENGGNNWVRDDFITYANLNSLYFTDNITGYVVGNGGTILKKTINMDIDTPYIEPPEIKGNLFNIYPNPAMDNFTIEFENKKILIKKIGIYDVTGKLVNKYTEINKYKIAIDVSVYSSGIYNIRIQTEDENEEINIENKKVVVLRQD